LDNDAIQPIVVLHHSIANKMDEIKVSIANHGHTWSLQTNKDMESLFETLHAAKLSAFRDIAVEKGLRYGSVNRHWIDVSNQTWTWRGSLIEQDSFIPLYQN